MKNLLARFLIGSLVVASLAPLARAQSVAASITVQQISPGELGSWTILSSQGTTYASTDKNVNLASHSFTVSFFGPMTFMVTPPPGMSAKITVYKGDEQVAQVTSQQYSFTPRANERVRFLVQYALTRLTDLGITSTPSGLRFRLTGPKGKLYSGTTPHTLTNIPTGTYAAEMFASNDCAAPAKKTLTVKAGERNVLNLSLICDQKEDLTLDRSRISKRAIQEYARKRELKKRGERK